MPFAQYAYHGSHEGYYVRVARNAYHHTPFVICRRMGTGTFDDMGVDTCAYLYRHKTETRISRYQKKCCYCCCHSAASHSHHVSGTPLSFRRLVLPTKGKSDAVAVRRRSGPAKEVAMLLGLAVAPYRQIGNCLPQCWAESSEQDLDSTARGRCTGSRYGPSSRYYGDKKPVLVHWAGCCLCLTQGARSDSTTCGNVPPNFKNQAKLSTQAVHAEKPGPSPALKGLKQEATIVAAYLGGDLGQEKNQDPITALFPVSASSVRKGNKNF